MRPSLQARIKKDDIPAAGRQGGQSAEVENDSDALAPINNPSHNELILIGTTHQNYQDIGSITEWGFLDNVNVNVGHLEHDIKSVPHRPPTMTALACQQFANLPAGFGVIGDEDLAVLPLYDAGEGRVTTLYQFFDSLIEPIDGGAWSQLFLFNCPSVIESFKSRKAAGKRGWVWGQIWHEQERILAKYLTFDRWELLEALQILLIFCLLRLQDAPVGYAVFDVSLLTTINVRQESALTFYFHRFSVIFRYFVLIARQVVSQALSSSVGEHFDCILSEDPSQAWRDWIFLESRRRTILVFQIIGLLVDISTTVSYFSMGGLVLVPLPSSAALWKIEDFEQWKPEYRKWHEEHTIYALSEIGDLIRLQVVDSTLAPNIAEWEGWSVEVGELATLVMIIGELLKE
ncbi:putative c6 finger domain protein [Rosellinia necatrix]|uniref:Putative c6 finger domain protein n=1 Tax=Rosellinia necatrix TaxID=77044 RepID=A0A1S8A816_ROSNE|nr:putative c6 finger domain protein [Rosellinia necatrix]